jgi:hypothetical protein
MEFGWRNFNRQSANCLDERRMAKTRTGAFTFASRYLTPFACTPFTQPLPDEYGFQVK